MIAWATQQIARYTRIPEEQVEVLFMRLLASVGVTGFILLLTAIVAFQPIFLGHQEYEAFQVGRIIQQDVFAPETIVFVSDVLTEQRRQQAINNTNPVFDPPDPAVARQQTEQARRILDYIANIRADIYSTPEQKFDDIRQITALALDDTTINQLFSVDDSLWHEIDTEIITIIERVMRDEIKSTDLTRIRDQLLPTQVSVRFNDPREINVIVSITSNLLRPNTIENITATEEARQESLARIGDETRSFEAGQLIISSGSRITEADYEALEHIGLLRTGERRAFAITRALIASTITTVIMGLYIGRFRPTLLTDETHYLALLSALFVLALVGARISLGTQIYLYPVAAFGLLFVAIIGAEVGIIGVIGLSFLIGIMSGNSLEIVMFMALGGIIGILNLRHAERLNSFFIAGLMVAAGNIAVVLLFNTSSPTLITLILYGAMNGILTAAAAAVLLYLITFIFNLPTALKLMELSQPNQPLLQRLLREAPGTYQHSLQVANLAEQAANAIGANAELTRVSALYHDIGKMLNPVFFTENQTEGSNPHDTLNDPYRSADIIIGHVTEGDELARQYRLPNRIRDFIREHHGTSQVYVFYQQAIILAGGNENDVDIQEFTYPGPKPQSRETGILMLADGCEAAVRSNQPKSRTDIEDVIHRVIDGRRKAGQLNESGLTLGDLEMIETIFAEILQAIYHPRINYTEAISRVRKNLNAKLDNYDGEATTPENSAHPMALPQKPAPAITIPKSTQQESDNDALPLAEVPRLRKNDDKAPKADEVATNNARADEQPAPDQDNDNE
jgi:putative nucleotidyltransferase with HDIG domain